MSATSANRIPALEKTIRVPWSPETAFRRFTADIADWWPHATHSVGQEKVETVVFEPKVGGSLYERHHDGTTVPWGTVRVWEPARRLVFTWHPGYGEDEAQEVEVTFHGEEGGTRVHLVHRGWERRRDGATIRKDYDRGWEGVLELYASRNG